MEAYDEWMYIEYLGSSEEITPLIYTPFVNAIKYVKDNNFAGKVQKFAYDKINDKTYRVREDQQRRGWHPYNQNKRLRCDGSFSASNSSYNNRRKGGNLADICFKFKEGRCNYGERCMYRHVEHKYGNNNGNRYNNVNNGRQREKNNHNNNYDSPVEPKYVNNNGNHFNNKDNDGRHPQNNNNNNNSNNSNYRNSSGIDHMMMNIKNEL